MLVPPMYSGIRFEYAVLALWDTHPHDNSSTQQFNVYCTAIYSHELLQNEDIVGIPLTMTTPLTELH